MSLSFGSLYNSHSRGTNQQQQQYNHQNSSNKEGDTNKKSRFYAEMFKPTIEEIQEASQEEKRTIHFIA